MNSPQNTTHDPIATSARAAAGPLFYRFDADLDVFPLGIAPEGLRMANSFDGVVTIGDLEGARVWGIDHLLLRSDGVGVIDAPKTISRGDLHIFEHVRGYCLPPAGLEMPPLEALLEPGFEWPDVDFPIVGFSTFRSDAPGYGHLNRATARIDGWANLANGRLAIETRLVAHHAEVAPPATVAA